MRPCTPERGAPATPPFGPDLLAAGGMLTVAAKLDFLPRLLAVIAAVLTVKPVRFHHARAGRVRAFRCCGHFTLHGGLYASPGAITSSTGVLRPGSSRIPRSSTIRPALPAEPDRAARYRTLRLQPEIACVYADSSFSTTAAAGREHLGDLRGVLAAGLGEVGRPPPPPPTIGASCLTTWPAGTFSDEVRRDADDDWYLAVRPGEARTTTPLLIRHRDAGRRARAARPCRARSPRAPPASPRPRQSPRPARRRRRSPTSRPSSAPCCTFARQLLASHPAAPPIAAARSSGRALSTRRQLVASSSRSRWSATDVEAGDGFDAADAGGDAALRHDGEQRRCRRSRARACRRTAPR